MINKFKFVNAFTFLLLALLLFSNLCNAQQILIEYQGGEIFQSEYFTTDKLWHVELTGDAVAYVYDVGLGNHVQTINQSTPIEVKGMIFLYVVPNSGNYSTLVRLQQNELNPPDLDLYNCEHFETGLDAQKFFEGNDYSEDNDPHRLDADGDGFACEYDPRQNYADAYEALPNCVDINIANIDDLKRITGIGSTIAQRVVDARPFSTLEELAKVKGIATKKISAIKLQKVACLN